MADNRIESIRAIATLLTSLTLPACSKDMWYGMGYDVLRQHDCRQQAPIPENAGCTRSYRDEYERYKRERETLLDSEENDETSPDRVAKYRRSCDLVATPGIIPPCQTLR